MPSACGRGFEIPDTDSAFDDGHSPRAAFLRCVQPSLSVISLNDDPLDCGGLLTTVEVDAVDEPEAVEDIDDEEFTLCGPFRGMNIRVTSSALMEFNPPCALLPEFHPNCGRDWKLVGAATAVICEI